MCQHLTRALSPIALTADMWGHPSHGMLRLPWYLARLQSGAMRPVTETETVSSFAAVSVIDGHDGIGQVVTHRAGWLRPALQPPLTASA